MIKKSMGAFVAIIVAVCAVVNVSSARSDKQSSDLSLGDLEVLAWCEVRNTKGQIKWLCTGNEGTCNGSKFGWSLDCSGVLNENFND
jgi:hypothetical protein